jgi:hypothetical protein
MHVIVCTYRARAGQEDAIVALHESWERDQRMRIQGYLSGELLCVTQDSRVFLDIARYDSATTAHTATADPEHIAWQQRLASLTEEGMLGGEYRCIWQSDDLQGEHHCRKQVQRQA